MKNVLFIKKSRGTYRGGIEGKILSLAEQFLKSHNIKPVLLTSEEDSLFAEEFKSLGLQVYSIRMDKIWMNRKNRHAMDEVISAHKIGIIQSHAFRESILARLYRRKRNNIANISRIHTHIQGSTIHPFKIWFYYFIDRITSKWVDHFVVISELLKHELINRSGIPAEKISVVYNGIPPMGPPDILPVENERLNSSVAIIGEIEYRKQQHLAIEAINILRNEGLILNLHLIGRGEGEYFENLIELIKEYGIERNVFIHGQVNPEAIYDIMKDSPVIILPSLFEGIPTSIIEAMSLRKIAVTTPVGATKELVKDKVNGYLHDTGNAKQLAEILTRIFTSSSDLLNPLRAEGYNTYMTKFTLERMMTGFYKVYSNLRIS